MFNFFLCELPLILRVDRKEIKKRRRKKENRRQEIFARGLQISNLDKIGQLA